MAWGNQSSLWGAYTCTEEEQVSKMHHIVRTAAPHYLPPFGCQHRPFLCRLTRMTAKRRLPLPTLWHSNCNRLKNCLPRSVTAFVCIVVGGSGLALLLGVNHCGVNKHLSTQFWSKVITECADTRKIPLDKWLIVCR